MNKLKIYLSIAFLLSVFTACNDDFIQRDPLTKPAEGSALKTTTELELYLNQLYGLYIEGHQTGWADSNQWSPLNVSGSHLMHDDMRSDNATQPSQNADDRLIGTHKTPQSAHKNNGWNWENLKQVNYFLRNYRAAEISVDNPDKLNRYAAEAYFFKAYDYYQKVLYFGEVPWLTWDLNVDSPELYSARTPREQLMDSVMWCVDYAAKNAIDATDSKNGGADGRINKDMANFLKARIALFEGTFRKYHTELGLQSTSGKYLEECVKACKAIIATGNYRLYQDNSGQAYWKVFTFKQDPKADGNNEAILARVYDGPKLGHAAQKYYEYNDWRNCRHGATRGLIDEYLCEDGRPIYTGGTEGSYQVNPLFEGYDGMWKELDNRDPRLRQTVAKPGEYITVYNRDLGVFGIDEVGIYYPVISYTTTSNPVGQYQSTVTGYRFIKHWMGDKAQANAITQGWQTAVEFRYGEVLIMLAEAEAELGTISNATLDLTINALRERGGFDFAKYPNAKLTLGNIPADPRMDAINTKYLDYPVSPILREIRRERRVEMAQEGRRYADLMRWKAGKFLTLPMRGMKYTAEKQKLYDGSRASKPIVNPVTGYKEWANEAIVGKQVFLDGDGFIICYPRSINVVDGQLPWNDYRYYFPIPMEELIMNPNLKQNSGWDAPQ